MTLRSLVRSGAALFRFKEECREAIGIAFIDTLVQDLRFTVRVLRKSSGFTVTAATTLALACARLRVYQRGSDRRR